MDTDEQFYLLIFIALPNLRRHKFCKQNSTQMLYLRVSTHLSVSIKVKLKGQAKNYQKHLP